MRKKINQLPVTAAKVSYVFLWVFPFLRALFGLDQHVDSHYLQKMSFVSILVVLCLKVVHRWIGGTLKGSFLPSFGTYQYLGC